MWTWTTCTSKVPEVDKSHPADVISFFFQPLSQRYPFIACEVIACEVWGIFDSALSNIDMLVKFWEFLDRPSPLNPVQASYFAKVIGVFLMKKTTEVCDLDAFFFFLLLKKLHAMNHRRYWLWAPPLFAFLDATIYQITARGGAQVTATYVDLIDYGFIAQNHQHGGVTRGQRNSSGTAAFNHGEPLPHCH